VEHRDLAAAIFEASHLVGRFELRSGRTAEEYFDKYRFEAEPRLLGAIAEAAAPLIAPEVEVLAGLEMGGIPVATALSLRYGLPVAFVRKAAKPYGTRRLAEGAEVAGRRVLIVEDVVTSGGQVLISAGELRALGAVVEDVLCVVDREDGGRAALAQDGLRLQALFTAGALRGTQPPAGR
jgi:orotate phosphoribosyltransferase